jgi:predicted AAA+ superfamily ATPase
LDLLCSSVGSLSNPSKISATIRSRNNVTISANTLKSYIGHLEDASLFAASKRYDVKGKSYFDFPMKYYCEDVGLRNARIGFRQMEMTHIMENIVHNELIARSFAVDVGVVYAREKNKSGNLVKVAKEIDFVAAKGNRRVYIQSAYAMATEEKAVSELRPLALTGDSFPKIMVRKDISKAWYDDHGILNVGIIEFLLDPSVLG